MKTFLGKKRQSKMNSQIHPCHQRDPAVRADLCLPSLQSLQGVRWDRWDRGDPVREGISTNLLNKTKPFMTNTWVVSRNIHANNLREPIMRMFLTGQMPWFWTSYCTGIHFKSNPPNPDENWSNANMLTVGKLTCRTIDNSSRESGKADQ